MQTHMFSMTIKRQENDLANLIHPPLPPLNVPAMLNRLPHLKHVPTQIAAARDTTFRVVSLRAAAAKATIAMIGEAVEPPPPLLTAD
jgi:hypothetical protein